MIETTTALFGLLVGFLVGLTGVGGGSLMTPFLLSIEAPAPTAIGTDPMYATVTKIVGSVPHYRQQSVDLQVAFFLGLSSLPASLLGVVTVELIERSYDLETVGLGHQGGCRGGRDRRATREATGVECDIGQGYYFSEPLPSYAASDLLECSRIPKRRSGSTQTVVGEGSQGLNPPRAFIGADDCNS